jgi:hypothetical protein
MAKPENPAEASVAARPPRPVQRVRLGAFAEGALAEGPSADGALPGRRSPDQHAVAEQVPAIPSAARHEPIDLEGRAARQLIDDAFDANAFDTARNLEAPDGFLAEDGLLADDGFEAEIARAESEMNPELSFSEDDGLDDADVAALDGDDPAGAPQVAARNPSLEPRPGLAWVRRRASGSWAQQASNGSVPSAAAGSRVPKLPVASLERPSTSRLELTPSPVPRVALAPATGAVDISLVPGPHTVGSRNLPTLAAQHLLGRRAPRRPAPAVTLPPPPSREPRSAFTLARDVRSSKGEIVLGLTIGLGVSLLLAGLGQAYLRGDPVADGSSAPSELESVTLSSRPDVAPAGSEASRSSSGAGVPANGEPARPAASSGARTAAASSVTARPTGSDGSAARRPAGAAGDGLVAGDAVVLAQAAGTKRLERTPQRATRPRHSQRASAPASGAGDPPPAAVPTNAVPSAISPPAVPSEPPPAASPLTPAESAGLGLDLPL